MEDPRVVDAIGTIEAIRRNKRLASGAAPSFSEGYADGGYVTGQTTGPAASTELSGAVSLHTIRAYVVYKDLENTADSMDRARKPFTRNK